MKRIMIPGAGYTQLPLHAAAHSLGYTTVAASIPGSYDCFAVADEISHTDISDPAAVLAAAREARIDAICTCGLDLPMAAIGLVAENLGIPGPSAAAAATVANKYSMKQALVSAGVQTAPFFCIRNMEELEAAMDALPFPVILKATDLMGGRGIFKSNTREEARENFKKSMAATKKDYCLIEQFIEGTLFGVEGMIQNGEIVFLMPDNTEIFAGATNIPVGHSVPLEDYEKHGDAVLREVTAAIRATGLDNCPINCDCILSGDAVYIVEITGRSGATGLSELVSLLYGINYYEVILRLAVGEDVRPYFAHKKDLSVLTHTLTAPREGILRAIVNHNPPCASIQELSWNVAPGDAVRPFTNGIDRIGQIILTADTLADCRRILKTTESHIRYELEGDLPLPESPVQELLPNCHMVSEKQSADSGILDEALSQNRLFVKREDLLPYSFGGNKVRFADAYLKDLTAKGCSAMIIYGGYSSNLCRILSQACKERNIPCSMIYNTEDSDPGKLTKNAQIIRGNGVKEYRCTKTTISDAVEAAMRDFEAAGYKPYYIHGNKFGQGNALPPVQSFADAYYEILKQERELGVTFDLIFLASSTNASQSGLIAGKLQAIREAQEAGQPDADAHRIIGISVNRGKKRAVEVIRANLEAFAQKYGRLLPEYADAEIILEDAYLCGGYGQAGEEIRTLSRRMFEEYALELDTTYTGKAFWGMLEYLKAHGIAGKNILFLHTGGTVLFRQEQETAAWNQ